MDDTHDLGLCYLCGEQIEETDRIWVDDSPPNFIERTYHYGCWVDG